MTSAAAEFARRYAAADHIPAPSASGLYRHSLRSVLQRVESATAKIPDYMFIRPRTRQEHQNRAGTGGLCAQHMRHQRHNQSSVDFFVVKGRLVRLQQPLLLLAHRLRSDDQVSDKTALSAPNKRTVTASWPTSEPQVPNTSRTLSCSKNAAKSAAVKLVNEKDKMRELSQRNARPKPRL